MDRDEDVTVELPVVETNPPPARVYVPPKTIPPKTKVATFELDTVMVRSQSELDPRHAPTIRVRRSQPPAPLSQEIPTNRPGEVWRKKVQPAQNGLAEDPPRQPPPPVDVVPPASDDAVTPRLRQPATAEAGGAVPDATDPREAMTQRVAHDLRDAATLSANRIRLVGQWGLDPPPSDPPASATPRPVSRVTSEELEAIQSARTLQVQQTPFPPNPASGGSRRGRAAFLIAMGVGLGILIVWVATLIARSSRQQFVPVGAASPSALAPTGPALTAAGRRVHQIVAPEPSLSVSVPDIVPVSRDSASASDPPAQPSIGSAPKSEPTASASQSKSRAIY